MTSPKAITPSRLRLILSASLVLIVVAGAGIFYLAYDRISQTATETGTSTAQARESQDTLQRLQSLQEQLNEMKPVTSMTSKVVANSQNYAYQDLLVKDLTIYANRANLRIKNISFSNQNAPSAEASSASPAGLQTAMVDITLETPVNYRNLLNFLHYVEQNLTKLKVSKVVMTRADEGGVSINALNLEVYVR